jgi:hypothetical protein
VFDNPIVLPNGKTLVTLKDAADYIMAMPKVKHSTAEWQAAAEALTMAAENCGPLMHAHVGMLRASMALRGSVDCCPGLRRRLQFGIEQAQEFGQALPSCRNAADHRAFLIRRLRVTTRKIRTQSLRSRAHCPASSNAGS